MATYNKFQQFVEDWLNGVHDFDTDTFKVYLSNAAPNAATHTIKADIAEITAENGYSAGGVTVAITTSEASGTGKIVGVDAVVTASNGTVGPFQYVIFYNNKAFDSNIIDPLIAWWDYGSAVTLQDGESFTVDFDADNGIFTVT